MLFQSPAGAGNLLGDGAQRNLKGSFLKIKETSPTFLGIDSERVTLVGGIYSFSQAESP